MNKVFIHTNAIEDRMLIKELKLDFYGDELFVVNFAYTLNVDDSMEIIKVGERKKYQIFPGAFSVS